ncbi:tRNA epoxyqueuosine(34) reductase QueG [Aestuariibacter halophilus]|uniref:Epoxyqueuosine reductase n=1 Tax=Fluctibacter halophilus TaxID=226011 RepID=A0ABS8GAV4_9ALTE|nr:tRNA epoxyqueuosine(34) reductase QueG [Aestuariibacter halophilus]MCC2617705.1 tRNA epoxyqueuosine(34) reductase QueG [Aestuariibacter halophilus]
MATFPEQEINQLAKNIKAWGKSLGFQQIGICDIDFSQHEKFLQAWLDKGYHGDMAFMAEHGMKRARPQELVPGTCRIISVRMDYLPPDASFARDLRQPQKAYISRYALGRDYHKVMRKRLKQLGQQIEAHCQTLNYRPFVDSAPVLEHAAAEKAGIGWTGKHSLTLNRNAGSWFFLGELFVDIPLPVDVPVKEECGDCTACMTICPTNAIVEPYVVDARRCISYLTIETKGSIPEDLRPLMGNRIYGCDDCQLICPWNRYAQLTEEADFLPRRQLLSQELITLLSWDEATFLAATEGSAIRRIGHQRWQRNIAVALGNAPYSEAIVAALQQARQGASPLVDEHLVWALDQQQQRAEKPANRQTERLIRSVEKGLPRDA